MSAVYFSTTKIIWDFLRSCQKELVLRRKGLRSSTLIKESGRGRRTAPLNLSQWLCPARLSATLCEKSLTLTFDRGCIVEI